MTDNLESLYEYDEAVRNSVGTFCGVDEAGRGPLAGDVYAAAVILDPENPIEGLNDSKKLSEKKREALYEEIIEKAEDYCIAKATVEEIEKYNILEAAMLAMRRAVLGLDIKPELALIDGNKTPDVPCDARAVVKGDGTSASIAAASVLAKVTRDRYMKELADQYPQYGFEKHKGYGTKLHCQAIIEYGPCPVHRPSFLKKLYAKNRSGASGEDAVCVYLEKKGYKILARNFTVRGGEIDIISCDSEYIVFTEVKTRDKNFISGIDSVDVSKKKRIIRTAQRYIDISGSQLQPRFDTALVITDRGLFCSLEYIENAFDGGSV